MKQLLSDLKLLVATDNRVWAGAGFIVLVLVVWALTGSWRPLPEQKQEKYVTVNLVHERDPTPLLEGLAESLGDLSETNDSLAKDIDRVSRNFESKQEEIDWNVDRLMSRLSSMSSTLNHITKKVGEREVEKFQHEERMKVRNPDRRRKSTR